MGVHPPSYADNRTPIVMVFNQQCGGLAGTKTAIWSRSRSQKRSVKSNPQSVEESTSLEGHHDHSDQDPMTTMEVCH